MKSKINTLEFGWWYFTWRTQFNVNTIDDIEYEYWEEHTLKLHFCWIGDKSFWYDGPITIWEFLILSYGQMGMDDLTDRKKEKDNESNGV